MVSKPRRKFPVQRCKQPALFRMQRPSVVDGASGRVSHTALSGGGCGFDRSLPKKTAAQPPCRPHNYLKSLNSHGPAAWHTSCVWWRMESVPAQLSVRNVRKSFHSKAGEVRVLDDLSFDINARDFVSIIG